MLTVGSFGPHIYAWIRVSSEFPGLRENVKSPESRSYIRGFCDVLCGNEGKVVWWGWSSGGEEYPPARTLSPRTLPNEEYPATRTLQSPPRTLRTSPPQFIVHVLVPHIPDPRTYSSASPTYSSHESPALKSPPRTLQLKSTLPRVLFRVPHVLFTRVPYTLESPTYSSREEYPCHTYSSESPTLSSHEEYPATRTLRTSPPQFI